jgi:flagellar L-ring protein precursor FlgH
MTNLRLAVLCCAAAVLAQGAGKTATAALSPLDRYIAEAGARAQASPAPSAGSTWSPASRFLDLAMDVRAAQVDDLVTILVLENTSAVSKGTVKTSRQSDVKASLGALAGPLSAAGTWANLASASGANSLAGDGSTTRSTLLSATLSARVTHVLPNGYLVVEGTKDLQVNSERQLITVRGMVRPGDIGAGNLVRSERLAELEVRVNGKGVVADAIKRPFFLYRLLLGLLPF